MKKLLLIIVMLLIKLNSYCQAPGADCSTAVTITIGSFTGFNTIANPPTGLGLGSICTGTIISEGWYEFANPSVQNVTIIATSLSANTDLQWEIFTGACGSLSHYLCVDLVNGPGPQTEISSVGILAVGIYYLRLTNVGTTDSMNVNISISGSQQPPNDNCAGAIALTPSTICNPTAGDVAFATQSFAATSQCSIAGAANDDVWYSFVATSALNTITVTSSPSFNAVFEVYSGSCGGTLITGGCVDVNGIGLPEMDTYGTFIIGQTYWIRVYDAGTGVALTTTFTICVSSTPNLPPVPSPYQSTDTIRLCGIGDSIIVTENFNSVEVGQITNVVVNLNGMTGASLLSYTNGSYIASVQLKIVASLANLGTQIITLTATDNGTPAATTILNLRFYVDSICTPQLPLVWPGDANYDSVVNNNDLLPIGLYYGQMGTPRTVQGNVWQGDTAVVFGTTQANGADIKHADCNGDGIIDANDTLAVNLNYNLIHAITVNQNQIKTIAPDIYFSLSGNALNAGDWVDAELMLGNAGTPVTDLYGISFTINYNSSLVQSGTESITYPASWLGTPGTDAIKIAKIDNIAHVAYGAETRINHTNASGLGKIADFKFQVNTALNDAIPLNLTISNYKANDANGMPLMFNPQPASITVVGINENTYSTSIIIAPNPFTSETKITFSEAQKNTLINITDVLGNKIKTINFSGKQCVIEKEKMQAGIYFIRIEDANKNIVNSKVVVQ